MSDSKTLEISPSISIIIAGVIIAAAIVYTSTLPPSPGAQAQGIVAAPTVNADVSAPSASDHIIGSLTAPVVLIEYGDLQCYYCGQVYPTIKKIVSESNGQIAWVHRHFPLESIHPEAKPAAIASECVFDQLGNDGFWKFVDAMYTNQGKMNAAYYTQVAQSLGADTAKFSSCVAAAKDVAKIDAQATEAAQNGGTGTPFTIIFGKGKQLPVSGAVPEAQFLSVIKSL